MSDITETVDEYGRIIIMIIEENWCTVVNQTIAALAANHPYVFVSGGKLVEVFYDDCIKIAPIEKWRLIVMLTNVCLFRKKKTEKEWKDVEPPQRVVEAILVDKTWSGIRRINGISHFPLITPEGTLRAVEGYDPETKYWIDLRAPIDPIPENPTMQDAIDAFGELNEIIKDFPFRNDLDVFVYISILLTLVSRHLCPTVPAFLISAAQSGLGKSHLSAICGIIVEGKRPSSIYFGESDSEVFKQILVEGINHSRLVVVDNLKNGSDISFPALDKTITSPTIKGRILGESTTVDMPNGITWVLTGNNVEPGEDLRRRLLKINLWTNKSPKERQESISDKNVLATTDSNREKLLRCVLIIIAAFLRDPQATDSVIDVGGFESWTRFVARPLNWLTDKRVDITDAIQSNFEHEDRDLDSVSNVLRCLMVYETATSAQISRLIEDKTDKDCDHDLRLSFGGLSSNTSSRGVGVALSKIKDKPILIDGVQKMLTMITDPSRRKPASWKVIDVPSAPPHEDNEYSGYRLK